MIFYCNKVYAITFKQLLRIFYAKAAKIPKRTIILNVGNQITFQNMINSVCLGLGSTRGSGIPQELSQPVCSAVNKKLKYSLPSPWHSLA